MTERITDKLIKSLELPPSKTFIIYDEEIRGFGVRVTSKGIKSFILNYRSKGRERRITIGRYPDWSVAAAREQAKALKREVGLGSDPMSDRHSDRLAPSMEDLGIRYLEQYVTRKSPKSQFDDRSMLENRILPAIGKTKISDITFNDIDALHRAISKTRPIRANRVVQLLSKMFNLSIQWGYRTDNPAKGIAKNAELSRSRFLSSEELSRLAQALKEHPNQQSANVIRLLLLTGARRGEVMKATWDQFDLKNGIWTKPSSHTKQKKEHRVPLSTPAVSLLSEIQNTNIGSEFVFPGQDPEKPLQDIKKFWASIRKASDLPGFRIHDIRHTYASILASSGLSLPIIGSLLGHTQASTTARYSHIYDDPLRNATEHVGEFVISNS